MTKMFCEHCGKDITHDKYKYDGIDLTDDIFGQSIYDIQLIEKYFGKKNNYFDLCDNCFSELRNKLFKTTAEFMRRDSKDDNN